MTEAHSINYNTENNIKQADSDFNFVSLNPVNQELDGIEILVSMAKTGKINPWNIDIVDITDKYNNSIVDKRDE